MNIFKSIQSCHWYANHSNVDKVKRPLIHWAIAGQFSFQFFSMGPFASILFKYLTQEPGWLIVLYRLVWIIFTKPAYLWGLLLGSHCQQTHSPRSPAFWGSLACLLGWGRGNDALSNLLSPANATSNIESAVWVEGRFGQEPPPFLVHHIQPVSWSQQAQLAPWYPESVFETQAKHNLLLSCGFKSSNTFSLGADYILSY